MAKKIALLGSTGSIGKQTLEIVRACGDEFEVVSLTADTNWELLARQAVEFGVDSVAIANEKYYPQLRETLEKYPIKVYAGEDAVAQLAANGEVEVVVNAIVGYAGMIPSITAVRNGKRLALANKESLVVAGEAIIAEAEKNGASIIPIDSEHSAILQSLAGEISPLRRVIITASGGPFLRTPAEELPNVTPEQALRHPNWSMGAKISVDSSTLINKGFEVIEAKWLFGLEPEEIEVLIHPQSVVHSMVEFADGAIKAQLGLPDMRQPIQYALKFPVRNDYGGGRFDFLKNPALTFEEVDHARFPGLGIAYECMRRGGTAACAMNAANEIAVEAFLKGKIKYTDIIKTIESTLNKSAFTAAPSLGDYQTCDAEARGLAKSFIGRN